MRGWSLRQPKTFYYVWGALALHSALFFLVSPDNSLTNKLKILQEKAIEIVSPEEIEAERRPVVKTSRLAKSEALSEKPRFSAEFENRVEHESRTPLIGSFQEGKQLPKPEESVTESEEGEKKSEMGALQMKNLLSFGRSPHVLPEDIPMGNQTLLSTAKVRYASFINRIADEIYQPWVDSAERAVREYVSQQRKIEPNLYVTKLRITLNTEGAVKAIQVLESCGVEELDEAPKRAFWEAEPFPNPPSQLLESDGYVRLTYEFQFEWRNSSFNIIPWKI